MILNSKDIKFKAVRAGGPGGQRTNRRSTKVQLWISIGDLPLSDIEKKRIRAKLKNYINHRDELEVQSDESRSQELNRDSALEKLDMLLREALRVPKKRIPMKPSRSAENRRIAEKKIIGEKKRARRAIK